jgi:hypothetical protein
MAKKADHREPLEYVFKGHTFDATYTVSSGMVHLTAIQGRKSAQLAQMPVQTMAEQLFREIINEANACGSLR